MERRRAGGCGRKAGGLVIDKRRGRRVGADAAVQLLSVGSGGQDRLDIVHAIDGQIFVGDALYDADNEAASLRLDGRGLE